jgi:hypothetical protein
MSGQLYRGNADVVHLLRPNDWIFWSGGIRVFLSKARPCCAVKKVNRLTAGESYLLQDSIFLCLACAYLLWPLLVI